jgi:hypothetical protein
MPTLQSEYYANQTGEMVRYRSASNISNGEFREATLEYKFGWKTGVTEATGDIIQFGRLDPGITVQADNMKLLSEGIGGTTVTLTAIGDQQVANRYTTTAVAATAAGYVTITPVPATTIPEVTITAGVNDVIQGTLGGTLPATAGKRIWLRVRYRMPS